MTLEKLFPLGAWVQLSSRTPWPDWQGEVVGHSGATTVEVRLRKDRYGREPAEVHTVPVHYNSLKLVDPLQVLATALKDERSTR